MRFILTTITASLALLAFDAAAEAVSLSTTTRDGRTISATAVTPYIIRVDDLAPGQSVAPAQSVLPLEAESDVAYTTDGGSAFRTIAGITVEASNGAITISGTGRGTTIVDNGARQLPDGRLQLSLATSSTGSYYGTGERGHHLNLRGDTLTMYNRANYGYTGSDRRNSQMNINMPLFLASDGFAIVFDDYAAAQLILGNPIKYTSESPKPISYYYISGTENMADLTEQLTELTGRQPLAPFWALGYITSKYGYHTQAETLGVVDTLKTHGYPVDALVLDLYWYGKEQDMGRLDWEPSQWPDPKGMLADLDSLGVKTLAITQPFVLRNGRGVDNYNALAPRGLFVADSTGKAHDVTIWVGEGGMFDVSNPDTRKWLTDRYRKLTDQGMGGWWGDLGEPEMHPATGHHANGLMARQYHNKYGNDWAEVISDLYTKEYSDRRLMTLMRAGTTGLQRFSVFPWSSDVSRSWEGLEPQIRIAMQSGLSGLAYMSSDLGGFAVDAAAPYLPELYVRWLQAGLFTPIFRTHAQQFAEPYNYPAYEDIIKDIVRQRYRWLPYNYSLAYENATKGWPLLRPLDFDVKGNGSYDNVNDEFLWGHNLLVAPVITKDATERDIVFPEGSLWYDISDPKLTVEGGSTLRNYPAPLDKLPLFARAGAFLPTADYEMQNTRDYRANEFTINYYPGPESHYTLFDDDRLSPRTLDEGAYRLIYFNGESNENEIKIKISSDGNYPGAPSVVRLNFVVNGLKKPFAKTKFSARTESEAYDPAGGSFRFTIFYTPGSETTITLKK